MGDAKAKPLFDAVRDFLGPLEAQYCRIIDEGSPDMPVTILLGNYKYETTLADIKALDRAYAAAFDARLKRNEKKSKGSLL